GLCDFLIGPFVMEAQNGYTVFVDTRGVDFTVVVVPSQCRAPTGHTHAGSIKAPIIVFKGGTITALFTLATVFGGHQVIDTRHPICKPIRRHAHAATVLDM